jgi:hypothetical protein
MKLNKFVLFFMLLILISTSVYAWFSLMNVYPVQIDAGNFDVEIDIYIDDVLVDAQHPYFDQNKNALLLEGDNTSNAQSIANLKVVLRIFAHNAARFRVRIQDEWLLTRTFINEQVISFVIPSMPYVEGEYAPYYLFHPDFFFVDNDIHLYYDGIILQGETLEITLIDGANVYTPRVTANFFEEVMVYFSLNVDVVQANRFAEVWLVDDDLFTGGDD